jgi:N-methylhydantoinase A
MERAVRAISLERGFDPREFTLVAFGGAGPQHACELAEGLGIRRVLAPTMPGALSAYGVAIADITKDYSQTVLYAREQMTADRLRQGFAGLRARALAELREEGVPRRRVRLQPLLDVRYVGQSYELTVDCPRLGASVAESAARAFYAAHSQRFGYADASAPIEVVNLRLKAVGISAVEQPDAASASADASGGSAVLAEDTVVFAGGPQRTPFLQRSSLAEGTVVAGPAVVLQMDATTVVPPGWTATVDAQRNLVITRTG